MTPIISSVTLAHQGGWDEVLLVGVPIVLIIGLLAIAKRRVNAQFSAGDQTEAEPSQAAPPGSTSPES